MNIEKFTIKSQEVIQGAQNMAQAEGHQSIENGHILKALIETDESVLPYILKKQGIKLEGIKQATGRLVESYPKVSGGQLYISQNANMTLVNAEKTAKEMGDEFVSLEHLLIGLAGNKDDIGNILRDAGLNKKLIQQLTGELRKGEKVSSQNAE